MAIFKKKNNDDDDFLNSIPSATGADDMPVQEEGPSFPVYNSDLGSIKRAVDKPASSNTIDPASRSMPSNLIPKREPMQPVMSTPKNVASRGVPGKPIFVKIDDYKDALEAIETIRGLANQADTILDQLTKLRSDEDRELNKWHSDIEKIKERLLVVDRKLFEQ